MYTQSISGFALTLTNDVSYYYRPLKINLPTKYQFFKKIKNNLNELSKAAGIDEMVSISRSVQASYLENNSIQLWDLLCMVRMTNSRMIDSKMALFKMPIFQEQTNRLMVETLKLKCVNNFFGKKKIIIMLPCEN